METSPSQLCTIQMEIPRFKRMFFCFPLREGLMVWGVVNAITVLAIAVVGIISVVNRSHYYPVEGMPIFMHCVLTLWSLLDAAASAGMVLTIQKGDAQRLNFFYMYSTVKFWGYAALILLSLTMQGCCYFWYWYNVYPVRFYLLMYDPAVGAIDMLLQGYLALLVRSQVLALGGNPRLSAFRVRCQLVYDQDPGADYAPVDGDLPIAYKLPGVDKPSEADKLSGTVKLSGVDKLHEKTYLHSVE